MQHEEYTARRQAFRAKKQYALPGKTKIIFMKKQQKEIFAGDCDKLFAKMTEFLRIL